VNSIAKNIEVVKKRIENVCLRVARSSEEVKLLLATKTVPAELIKQALIFENNFIGENKIQELSQKRPLLKNENVEFHFIGHLQTNKIKEVLKYANCIQSLDRIELAQKLNQRLQFEGRSIDVLIQVNTSYEESKFGVSPEKALAFAKEVSQYDTLKVKGLMTIGIFNAEQEKIRKCFKLLSNIRNQIAELNLKNVEMNELSMGMSGDLEIAIEEGATIVRVGTAIFGNRIYPDSYYWNEQV
jgi:pyridoxal phosphate enzyme (YggS family)